MNTPHIPSPILPITLTVPGDPAAQPRHQVAVRGGFAKAYIPSKNPIHAWKKAVQVAAINARIRNLRIEGPVGVSFVFVMPRPAAHHFGADRARPVRDSAPYWHTSKPDLDNLEKAVLDALADVGVFHTGDQQVCRVHKDKIYGSQTCVHLTITKLECA